jgi:hypothetical protein
MMTTRSRRRFDLVRESYFDFFDYDQDPLLYCPVTATLEIERNTMATARR